MANYVIPSKLGISDPIGVQNIPLKGGLKGNLPAPSFEKVAQSSGFGSPLSKLLPFAGPVASILGIGSQIVTNHLNREMVEDINRENRRLIQEQNAYNSPVSQMARFKAAGLNPLAALNQVGPGNQESLAPQIAPSYESPSFGNVSDAIHNSLQYRLQEQQTAQLASLRQSQMLFNTARYGSTMQQFEQTAALFNLRKEALEKSNENLVADLRMKDANIDKLYSDARLTRAQVGETFAKINNLFASSEQYRAQVAYLSKLTGLSAWQLKYADAYYSAYMKSDIENTHMLQFNNALGSWYTMRALAAETVVAESGIPYTLSKMQWDAETSRANAGITWDEWQQGQARKNYNTYFLGTINAVSSGIGAVFGAGKLGGLSNPTQTFQQPRPPQYHYGADGELGTMWNPLGY